MTGMDFPHALDRIIGGRMVRRRWWVGAIHAGEDGELLYALHGPGETGTEERWHPLVDDLAAEDWEVVER